MAATKITSLTSISTVDTALDPIPIVDVSDTSQSASGTTKKITVDQIESAIFGATGSKAIVVDNVAALKALTVASVDDGQVFLTRGYYSDNDGGQGTYVYDAASSTSDNGGTVIAPTTGSGRYLLQVQNIYNIKQFGAKGDNSTDDTAEIQAAINAAPKGGLIYVPAGVYRVSATLTGLSGKVLSGETGPYYGNNPGDVPTSNFKRTANVRLIEIAGTDESNIARQGAVRNIGLDGSGYAMDICGLFFCMNLEFTNVNFYSNGATGTSGPAIAGVVWWDTILTNCRFDQCGGLTSYAVEMKNSYDGKVAVNSNCNNIAFIKCTFEQCPRFVNADRQAIASRHNRIRFYACKFESIVWGGGTMFNFNSTADVTIADSFTGYGTLLSGVSTSRNYMVVSDGYGFFIRNFNFEAVGGSAVAGANLISITNSIGVDLENVLSIAPTAGVGPSGAIVAFSGTVEGSYKAIVSTYNVSTLTSGTILPYFVKGKPQGDWDVVDGKLSVTRSSAGTFAELNGSNAGYNVVHTYSRAGAAKFQSGLDSLNRYFIYDNSLAATVLDTQNNNLNVYRSLFIPSTSKLLIGNVEFQIGTGNPEGVVGGNPGAIFIRTDAGSGSALYVLQRTGYGVNGWTAK